MKQSNHLWIYILECENGNYYTGYTKNLVKRFQLHLAGKANSKYTRSFKPEKIAQCWWLFDSIGTALKVERFIKKQTRKTKTLFVEHPHELKKMIVKRMNMELEIIPIDPKSMQM